MIIIDVNGQLTYEIAEDGTVTSHNRFPSQTNPVTGVVGRQIFDYHNQSSVGSIGQAGYQAIISGFTPDEHDGKYRRGAVNALMLFKDRSEVFHPVFQQSHDYWFEGMPEAILALR